MRPASPPRFQTVNLISTNRTWRFYAPDPLLAFPPDAVLDPLPRRFLLARLVAAAGNDPG